MPQRKTSEDKEREKGTGFYRFKDQKTEHIRVRLDIPPSNNELYNPNIFHRRNKQGRKIPVAGFLKCKSARVWEEKSAWVLSQSKWKNPFQKTRKKVTVWEYEGSIFVSEGRHFTFDLTNRWKAFEDLIAKFLGIDDRYILSACQRKILSPERFDPDYIVATLKIYELERGKKEIKS